MRIGDFNTERKVGDVTIHLPDPPNLKDIDGYNLASSSQRFTRPTITNKEFNSWDKETQRSFYRKEMDKRLNGYWFFNNGNIEYITGVNYFYVAYWKIDTGYPKFKDNDRDFFYFWRATVVDPDCYGTLYIADRREGKTYKANCINYETVTRQENAHGGIQSKTDTDGKKVFQKLVFSWKRLPDFWKPVDSGETNPKTELKFEEPGARNSKGIKKEYKDVLDSFIDFESALEEGYDGQKLQFLHNDEFGKTKKSNVVDRWDVQKFCLVDEDRGGIIGKSLFTTTVEEMEKKGGDKAKILWDKSDPLQRNDLNQTDTGLWRYFKSADYGFGRFNNEYGYTDRDKAREYILAERKGKKGSSLANLIRKRPLTIEEAFTITDKSDVFPTFKIYEQKEFNFILNSGTIRQGEFIENEDSKIEFRDNPEGNWKVSWIPKPEDQNKVDLRDGRVNPGNERQGCIGVDPYDHETVSGDRKSNAGIYGFRNFSLDQAYSSHCFVCQYLYRPENPRIMFNEVLKVSRFYGWKFLAENNKHGVINNAKDKGFPAYVMRTQVSDYTIGNNRKWVDGINVNGDIAREELINGLTMYIYDHIGKIDPQIQIDYLGLSEPDDSIHGNCPFDELLTDWINFDANKWTDHDATVASMIAYHGARRYFVKKRLMAPEGDKKPLLVFPKTKL